MRSALSEAKIAAGSDSIALLLGESGCGKDYLARWIHDHSKRASGPYFSINCAAIAKELAESELFGHEAGAFTGARGARKGLLQLAEGGTLLLNEIGELPISLQAKLLTFLDTKQFLRVGGEQHVRVDARIMAATHRNLGEEIEKGHFLSALYYRLNVLPIEVPPLRERREDVPLLINGILAGLATELQLAEPPEVNPINIGELCRHDWPGNVRELRNVLERALILWDGGSFHVSLTKPGPRYQEWCYKAPFPSERSLHHLTDDFRYCLCSEALRRAHGSKHEAARLLEISRGALYRYMKHSKASREIGTSD
jgi:DNA-binding NtrC family response regulator